MVEERMKGARKFQRRMPGNDWFGGGVRFPKIGVRK